MNTKALKKRLDRLEAVAPEQGGWTVAAWLAARERGEPFPLSAEAQFRQAQNAETEALMDEREGVDVI